MKFVRTFVLLAAAATAAVLMPPGAAAEGAPKLSAAWVDGASLKLTFDETLGAAASLANEAFTVKKTPQGGGEQNVSLSRVPAIGGATVTLTLANAVLGTDTDVKVSYTKPTSGTGNRLRGAGGNEVASFSEPVTNVTGDTTPPKLVGGEIDGGTMTLYFSEALDPDSVAGTFRVTILLSTGVRASFNATGEREISANKVTVGLGKSSGGRQRRAKAGEQGNSAYYGRPTDPTVSGLRDLAGNPVWTLPNSDWTQIISLDNPAGPPWVTKVVVSSDAGTDRTYARGETIRVTLKFSEAVNVTGTPRVKLDFSSEAGGEKWAAYASGSGTNTLEFAYTVAQGDASTAGVAVLENTLELNGGTIQSASTAGENATLAHAGLDHNASHKVDGKPHVTGVEISSDAGDDATYALGETVRMTLTFTEAVAVTGAPRLKLDLVSGPGGEQWAAYESGGGTTVLEFAWTVAQRDLSTQGVAVLENTLELNGGTIQSASTAGPNATLAHAGLDHDANHRVDGIPPALSATWVSGAKLTLIFNEPLGAAGSLANGAFAVKKTPPGGSEQTVSLSGTPAIDGATVTLTLANAVLETDTDVKVSYTRPTSGTGNRLRDEPGNEVVDFSDESVKNIAADTTLPRLVRGEIEGRPRPAFGSTVTLRFSEALDEDSVGGEFVVDVQVGVGLSQRERVRAAGRAEIDGSTVTFGLRVTASEGTWNRLWYNRPTDGTTGLRDLAGNEASSLGPVVLHNSTRVGPTPLSVTGVAFSSDAGADRAYARGETIRVTVTFSEAVNVTGTPRVKLDFSSAAGDEKWAAYASGSGTKMLEFAYTVAEGDTSSAGVAVLADTLEFNGGTIRSASAAGESATLAHARLAHDPAHRVYGTPSVLSVSLSSEAGADRAYELGETIRVTVTFSEAVNVTGTPRVKLDFSSAAGDEKWAAYASGSGTKMLEFAYTVAAGDTSAAGVAVLADTLEFNGGTIRSASAAGESATLAHARLAHDPAHRVYTTPSVRSMSLSSDAGDDDTYGLGETIRVRLTCNEMMVVTGAPRLKLDFGFRARDEKWAAYASGSGTKVLEFAYTVAEGDTSAAGVAVFANSLDLNGGTIQSASVAGENATLAHVRLARDLNHRVDATLPTLSAAAVDGATLTLTFDELLGAAPSLASGAFTVKKTPQGGSEENVSLSASPAIDGRAVTLTLANAVLGTDTDVKVSYTRPTSDTGNRLRDAAGNEAASFSDQPVTNRTGVVVTGVAISSDAGVDRTYTLGETIRVRLTGNEMMVVTGAPRLKLDFGYGAGAERWAVYASGSGTTMLEFAYTVAQGDTASEGIAVPANTLELNGGTIRVASAAGEHARLAHPGRARDRAHKVDGAAPTLSVAKVDGTTLTLAFDEALGAAASLANRAFTVKKTPSGGGEQTVSLSGSPAIDGATVTLTLANAVLDTDTDVKVSYTRPTSGTGNRLRDAAGNEVASFTDQAVSTDVTPPALTTLAVDAQSGKTLTLTFDENLAAVDAAAGNLRTGDLRMRFALQGFFTAQGSPVRSLGPDTVAISGQRVTLTLLLAAPRGRKITVSYDGREFTAPGLQDAVGNPVASFSAVATRTGSQPALPVAAQVEGAALVLTFDKALDESSRPAGSRFHVRYTSEDGDSESTVSGTGTAAVSGKRVKVALASAVPAGSHARVFYRRDTEANPLREASSGPLVGAVNGFHAVLLSQGAPVLDSGIVTGTKVTLYYDKALDTDSKPASGDFTVTVGSAAQTVSGVSMSESAVTLTLNASVASGTAVTVGYTAGTNPIRSLGGTNAANLSGASMTNHGPTDTAKPALAATASAVVSGEVLTLSWDKPLDPAVVPERVSFTVSDPWRLVESVAVRGKKVEINLDGPLYPCSQSFTVSYTKPGADALRSVWGTEADGFKGQAVTNESGTCVAEWLGNARTGSVILRGNRPFATDAAPRAEWFTVAASGGPVTVTGAAFSADDPHELRLSVSRDFAADETVTVSYRRPQGAAGLWDVDGNQLADITDRPVANGAAEAAAVTGVAVVSDAGDDATYAAGDTVRVAVTFDEAVEVDTEDGTPRLKLDLGGDDGTGERWAAYADGSGTATLTFARTAAAPDESAAGVAVLADTLELNGGTIKSVATTSDAALGHAGRDPDPAHKVDTTPPQLLRGEIDGGTVTLWFSEALDPGSTGGYYKVKVLVSKTSAWIIRATGPVTIDGETATVELGAGNPRTQEGLNGNLLEYLRRADGTDGSLRDLAGNPVLTPHTPRASPNTVAGLRYVSIDLENVTGKTARVTGAEVVTDAGGDGAYAVGGTVEAAVTFDAPVTVGTEGGAPTLALIANGGTRLASYASGAGTETLTFAWRVGEADGSVAAPVRVAASGLKLNGGSIASAAGKPASLGFGEAPGVTAVSVATRDDGSWETGDTVEAVLTFAEPVTVEGAPSVGLVLEGASRRAVYAAGSGTDVLAFRYTLGQGDGPWARAALAGNSLRIGGGSISSAGGGLAAVLGHAGATGAGEADPPAVTGVTVVSDAGSDATYGLGERIRVRVAFSEAVAVTGSPGIAIDMDPAEWGEKRAVYESGSGTDALVFVHEVVEPNLSRQGIAVLADTLALHGGATIRSAATQTDAALGHTGRGHDPAHKVDWRLSLPATSAAASSGPPSRPPSVTGVEVVSDSGQDDTYLLGDTIRVRLAFSEAVKVTGTPRLAIDMDPAEWGRKEASYEGATGTAALALTFAWTVVEPNFSPRGIAVLANSLVLGGGTIRSAATGAAAALGHAGRGHDPAHKVDWRPAVSVADARGREGTDEAVVFEVSLDRAFTSASHRVTVDYATADGTAKAGEDYTAGADTLTFAAGERVKTVSVPILDDSHDEGEETFTLRLANATGARIGDAEATGTIVNTDPMPRAWLARFGRTVAEQVVDAVGARLAAPRGGGAQARIAGQELAGVSGLDADESARLADQELARWLAGTPEQPRTMTGGELLAGSAFAVTSAVAEDGPAAALWGRGGWSRFEGREGSLSVDGEVTTALLGAEVASGAWLGGVMLSHARGDGSYRGDAGAGTVASTLTAVHPYVGVDLSERLTAWAAGGLGLGGLTLTPEGAGVLETDLSLLLAALGARGRLVEPAAGSGFLLAIETDAYWVRTGSAAASGLAETQADATRIRLGLDGGYRIGLDGGGTLEPTLEVGVRHDGGHAETGYGMDLGGGLAWSDPALGLSAQVAARGLLTAAFDGFRDLGLSGSLAWDSDPASDRGPSLTVTQTVGAAATGGRQALLGRSTLAGLAATGDGLDSRRLELKFGYGFPAFGERFTATPEFGVALSDTAREIRLGWKLGLAGSGTSSFELGVEATRTETANDSGPEHGIRLKLDARF